MAKYNMVHAVFDRSGLAPNEDVAVCTMHIRQVVAAAPDLLPVTDEGRTDFVSRFGNFWLLWDQYVSSKVRFRELRFYDVPDTRGEKMGDPVLVHTFDLPGGSTTNGLPPQDAVSVTFRTPHRLNWGRIYLPGWTVTNFDSVGRPLRALCDELATAAHFLTDRGGTGAALTVFSRKNWTHYDPSEIQVDDVTDIIRRRRFSNATYRARVPAG